MATTFVKYDGDGSDATWDFSFPLYEATDVKVQVDGVLKTLTTHYTVAVTGTSPNISGGTVTFTSGNIPPSGTDNIYIYRDTAVDTIKQLTGRSFTWINGDKKSFGIIAQEVQSVLPDIVDTPPDPANKYPDDPMRSVNYAALTGHLIEAIKELSAKIETLETKVAALEAA